MKGKTLVIGVIVLLLSSMAIAQDPPKMPEKETIIIDLFNPAKEISDGHGLLVRNAVMGGFSKVGRLNVVDRSSNDAIKRESGTKQTSESFTAESILADSKIGEMKNLGAKYLMSGSVTKVLASKSSDTATMFNGYITFSLSVFNLDDGSTVASKTFDIGSGLFSFGSMGKTKEEAITNTSMDISKAVIGFINEHFKIRTSILEITAKKKDQADELYILGGKQLGVMKDLTFNVIVETMRGSYKTTKTLGVLKAILVEDEVTKCKVTKGGKEILDMFNTDPENVYIVSDKESANVFKQTGSVLGGLLR